MVIVLNVLHISLHTITLKRTLEVGTVFFPPLFMEGTDRQNHSPKVIRPLSGTVDIDLPNYILEGH